MKLDCSLELDLVEARTELHSISSNNSDKSNSKIAAAAGFRA